MNKKLLWKIESLWGQYYKFTSSKEVNIQKKYIGKVSKYNPDFELVDRFSFEQSEQSVHRDDYGSYYGLKKSQVLKENNKLIYLFDNHNKIIQPFLEYYEAEGQGFDVVHIDAHPDDAVFSAEKPHHLELKHVQEYINQTRISDFFDFLSNAVTSVCHCEPTKQSVIFANVGIQEGSDTSDLDSKKKIPDQVRNDNLMQNIYRYTKSLDFKEFKKPTNPYILSLDIDIFGPEGDFVDIESKIRIIAKAWAGADMVCLATSPGFIDQDFARGIVEVFCEKIDLL